MTNPKAITARCDWGVPLGWAKARGPEWEDDLRRWLSHVRAEGLTQIVVTPQPYGVDLSALRPGDKWEDAA
jgi:hypothetical protein